HSLEISLYRQGLLARLGSKLGGDRRYVQPDDGPLREVRHDVQRGRALSGAIYVTWKVCGARQRLGLVAALPRPSRFRQIAHEIPEHQAIPWRGLDRPQTGPPAS